jgi:hypothetical protein
VQGKNPNKAYEETLVTTISSILLLCKITKMQRRHIIFSMNHKKRKKKSKIKTNSHNKMDIKLMTRAEEYIYRGSRELPEAEASLPFLQLPRSPAYQQP